MFLFRNFEIGGKWPGPFTLFLYPQAIALHRENLEFREYMTNYGGKNPSVEGKWECFFSEKNLNKISWVGAVFADRQRGNNF